MLRWIGELGKLLQVLWAERAVCESGREPGRHVRDLNVAGGRGGAATG